MRTIMLALVMLVLGGCASENPTDTPDRPTIKPLSSTQDESADVESDEKCFCIPSQFSGSLSEEQEQRVPIDLRGAYTIESVRQITAADLEKELQFKNQVAEETQQGKRYVALRDIRCVQFSDELSGLMIVIERYVVTAD